jgi:hypothetical protein
LFLELSQFTTAKTNRELELEKRLAQAEALLREAVEVAWCEPLCEWFGNDIEDDWFERAKEMIGDTISET